MPLKVNNQEHTVKYPKNPKDIEKILMGLVQEKLTDKDFSIHLDGSVSVFKSIRINYLSDGLLPIPFNEVVGNFICPNTNMKSLKGCPQVIHGDFCFSNNKVVDLKYCPKIVKGEFRGSENQIKEVLKLPEDITNLDLSDNKIKTFNLKNHNFLKLTHVNLSFNKLLSLYNSFDSAPNIETLDLSVNQFSNQQSLRFLYKLPNLELLYLSQNLLEEIKIKKNPKLTFLHLSYNKLKDTVILDAPHIRVLAVNGNKDINIKNLIKQTDLIKCTFVCDIEKMEEDDLILLLKNKREFYVEHLHQINHLYIQDKSKLREDCYKEVISLIEKRKYLINNL